MIHLQNENWSADINPKGAELSSLINLKTKREFIWQGDPNFWGRRAPILFPIIGGLKEDKYILNGKTYFMGKHGFCRDAQFKILSHEKTKAILEFNETKETLEQFPFSFSFQVIFELTPQGLTNRFKILNKTEETLWFCLGGHPAFNLPMEKKLSFGDYKIRFAEKETLPLYYLENDLLAGKKERWLNDQDQFDLKISLFDNDALIFHGLKSKEIFIEAEKGESFVKFNLGSFPMVGIWTKEGGAPFLCVEPWYGVDDDQQTDGDFTKKWEVVSLASHNTYDAWFSIGGK